VGVDYDAFVLFFFSFTITGKIFFFFFSFLMLKLKSGTVFASQASSFAQNTR